MLMRHAFMKVGKNMMPFLYVDDLSSNQLVNSKHEYDENESKLMEIILFMEVKLHCRIQNNFCLAF